MELDFEDTQAEYHSFTCSECGSHDADFEDAGGREILTCLDCGYFDPDDI